MATKTITGKVTDAANAAIQGATVKATISVPAYVIGTAEVLGGPVSTTSASDGTYSLTLHANGDLSPANSYYFVQEDFPAKGGNSFAIQVPQTAGPFVASNIMVVPPAQSPVGAIDAYVVHQAGAETVTGVKTFSANPVFNAAAILDASLSSNVVLKDSAQTISGVKHFTGGATFDAGAFSFAVAPTFNAGSVWAAGQLNTYGTGDDLDIMSVDTATTGQTVRVRAGTAAAPDTTLQPLVKITRYLKLLDSQFTLASDPIAANISSQVVIDQNSERQGIAILGLAKTFASTTPASGKSPDAFGGIFQGRVVSPGTHTGGGIYAEGRKDTTAGVANGAEIRSTNASGSDNAFVTTSFSQSMGLWVTASGGNLSGVAVALGGQSPSQWDVGLGGTTYSGISSVKTAFIWDHTQALTSILIDNTHATAAIAVAAGSNMVLLGGLASVFGNANAQLELQGNNNFIDGLLAMGSTTNLKTYTTRIRNSSGQMSIGIVGVANDLITGTIAGDGVFRTSSANKFVHMGGTVSVVKVGNDNTLGFYNHATAAQQTPSGSRGGNAALASLLTALAAIGLIVDGTSA